MDEDNFLELLDLYMDMVEKQDEIIYRLGKAGRGYGNRPGGYGAV